MNKTCFVCEYGWIVVGKETGRTEDVVNLKEASIVRRWTNGKGIGGIAKIENKSEYTLDAIGDVVIRLSKVLFEIPCEW